MHKLKLLQIFASLITAVVAVSQASAETATEPFTIPQDVRGVLSKYCADCHGDAASESLVDLSALTKVNLKARLELLNKAQDQLFFHLMPPREASQPSDAERALLAASADAAVAIT